MRGAALISILALVASCTGSLPNPASYDAAAVKITEQFGRDAARATIIAGPCPVSKQPTSFSSPETAPPPAMGPLLAALAPVAVDFAVRAVSDYLKRAKAEQSTNYLATGVGRLQAGCLVIVRGNFGRRAQSLPDTSGILDTSQLDLLGLSSYPSLYMEASIEPENADGEYTIRPQALQFAQTAALRHGDGRKSLGMVIVLRGTPVDKPDKEAAKQDASAVIPLDFGVVKEGSAVRTTGQGMANVFADQARSIKVKAKGEKLNIYGFVVETGEPSQVLSLIVDTFEANKDDIKKAITSAVTDALTPPATK